MTNEVNMFMNDFESYKEYAPNGVEIWRASNLMKLFGYDKWERFNDTINRSMGNFDGIIIRLYEDNGIKSSFPVSGSSFFDVNLHFIPTTRTVSHNGALRDYTDYYLTRLACYAVAMEADNRKPAVKLAKQYLLYSALEAEKMRQQFENIQRIDMRTAMSEYENSLESTYAQHGVRSSQFGYVKSQGDVGFYNNPGGTKAVKDSMGIPKNKPLYDYMPYETMIHKAMANIDTKYGIINKELNGSDECAAEAYEQNKKQREHMYENSGQYPEDTMPTQNITDTKKDVKSVNQQAVKSLIDSHVEENTDPRLFSLIFNYMGYTYNLGQWCFLNNVDPMFILSLIDSGIPFDQAIFIRPNNMVSPIVILNQGNDI